MALTIPAGTSRNCAAAAAVSVAVGAPREPAGDPGAAAAEDAVPRATERSHSEANRAQ